MKKRSEDEIQEFFWSRVEKTPYCWIWKGTKAEHHGRIYVGRYKSVATHYYAWMLEHGEYPKHRSLIRLCDNSFCCRPSHYQVRPKRPKPRQPKTTELPTVVHPRNQYFAGDLPADGSFAQALFAALKVKRAEDHRLLRIIIAALREQSAKLDDVEQSLLETRTEAVGALGELARQPVVEHGAQLDRIERRLGAIAEYIRDRPAREARPPEPPSPAAERSLGELLRAAFVESVGPVPYWSKEDDELLDGAFVVALGAADGDSERTSETFRAWLGWYRQLSRASPATHPPTPEGFVRAVTSGSPARPAAPAASRKARPDVSELARSPDSRQAERPPT